MLFDSLEQTAAVSAEETRPAAEMGRAFRFDWQAGVHRMDGGTPHEVVLGDAVEAWVRQVVRTRPGRYAIYPADVGCNTAALRGRKIPKGFVLSQLRQELLASAAYCPAIREVGPLTYDGEKIQGTLTLEDGNLEVVTFDVAD